MKNRPLFRVATAGLGKYRTGGYGCIGVYRVKNEKKRVSELLLMSYFFYFMSKNEKIFVNFCILFFQISSSDHEKLRPK